MRSLIGNQCNPSKIGVMWSRFHVLEKIRAAELNFLKLPGSTLFQTDFIHVCRREYTMCGLSRITASTSFKLNPSSKQTGIHDWKQRIVQHFIFDLAAYSEGLRVPWLHKHYKWHIIVKRNNKLSNDTTFTYDDEATRDILPLKLFWGVYIANLAFTQGTRGNPEHNAHAWYFFSWQIQDLAKGGWGGVAPSQKAYVHKTITGEHTHPRLFGS